MAAFSNFRHGRLTRPDGNPTSGRRRFGGRAFLGRGLATLTVLGATALTFGVLGSTPAAPDTNAAPATTGATGNTGNTGAAGDAATTTTTTAPTTTTTTAATTTTTTTTTNDTTTPTTPTTPAATSGPATNAPTAGSINDGSTVIWTGNGTVDGTCKSFQDDTDFDPIPAGDMAWLFILTHPGAAPYNLTTNLGDATPNKVVGSVHFILYTPLGSTLTSASATNGNGENSVLTVSHCENGTPAIPTTIMTTVFDATTGVQWSGNETVGASAEDTSTVTPGNQNTAGPSATAELPTITGTVTYTFFTNGTCDGTDGVAQTVDITDGVIPHSPPTLSLAAGSYSYEAVYNGDSNYAASPTGGCEPFSVGQAPTSTSTILNDAATNAPWTNTETAPAQAYDTSTVSGGIVGFVPTGTVTYSFFTNGTCTSTPASTQDVTLSGGSVPNSDTTAQLAAGSYSFDAVYGGDSNYVASAVSGCETFTVAAVTSGSTATPNTPATSAGTTATPAATTPAATKGAAIAFTGADLAGMWAGAVVLLGLGGLLVLTSRRRKGRAAAE
ncbi:MAG TPA: hypothetical protein VHZ05_02095 [Acidimicrobiales bacterium]|nr:hypothetical protein [Acidimicrobiales bacterium]